MKEYKLGEELLNKFPEVDIKNYYKSQPMTKEEVEQFNKESLTFSNMLDKKLEFPILIDVKKMSDYLKEHFNMNQQCGRIKFDKNFLKKVDKPSILSNIQTIDGIVVNQIFEKTRTGAKDSWASL